MRIRTVGRGVAFALLLCGVVAGAAALEAQATDGRLLLQPQPSSGGQQNVIPFMEGWYANEDGTYTVAFGYLNLNQETVVAIPVGEDNRIEVAEYDGMQPTIFLPGRHRGVFAVTLPADRKGEDVWWNLGARDGTEEVMRVPGRTSAIAYELDWNKRPQGSLHPLAWFESGSGEEGRGPGGIAAGRTVTATVGSPIVLSINARDPSERDPDDFRSAEGVALRVVWSTYQSSGDVEFTRHESNPVPEQEEVVDSTSAAGRRAIARNNNPPGPESVRLEEGHGLASVIVTFSEPGEYVLRAQVDNFNAVDSASNDQCCWTNGYVRVHVTR